MIFSAVLLSTNRPGITNTLASLCWRMRWAISGIHANPARTPWCLLRVMLIPSPLPHTGVYLAAFDAFGQRMPEVAVVTTHVTVSAIILILVSMVFKILNDEFL